MVDSPASDRAEGVDCSVLVPVYNEERYIERSVEAMRRQHFDGSLEFVFADGGSSDRTHHLLSGIAQQDRRIRVFDNPSRTVSSGLNVALREARGHWVARMDAHTEYPEDYIALGVERLRRGNTRWVSGPQVPKGDTTFARAVSLALGLPLGRGGSRKWGRAAPTRGAEFELDTGVFAGVWERATLLEYGGWDERWRVNEDSEMAGRFIARGECLICIPAMAAQYAPRDSIWGLWRQYEVYGRYRARTSRVHPATMRRSHLLAPSLVSDVILAAVATGRTRRWARAGLRGYGALLVGAGISSFAARPSREAALVPVALGVMHLAHGTGFIDGSVRYGPPLVAVAGVAGLARLADAIVPASTPVFNPSLRRPRGHAR